MAPVYSKASGKLRPEKDLRRDALLIATDHVRPAIDALLSVLDDSLSGCHVVLEEMGKLLESALHVSLETILVLLYNAFVFAYLPAAGLGINSPASLIFHALIFMILSSMLKAANTDPGAVPKGQEWGSYGSPPAEVRETKRSGEARWCKNTGVYKPDRAHHCRSLGRVVLRMDHHCPWIGNTVGFANHKFFFLFLLYANAACGMLNISLLELLTHATLPALTKFLLIGSVGLSSILSAILGPFFLFHCFLLSRNMTTVEFSERSRDRDAAADEDARPSGVLSTKSPYDLGLYWNLCAVLGKNPLLWLAPVGGPMGDGVSYPRTPGSSHNLQAGTEDAVETDVEMSGDDLHSSDSDCSALESAAEATQSPAEDVPSLAWRAVADITDDFWVGCEFVGEAAKDGCSLLGDAAGHSLLDVAQCGILEVFGTFSEAGRRFSSICSSSCPGKERRRSSRRASGVMKTTAAVGPTIVASVDVAKKPLLDCDEALASAVASAKLHRPSLTESDADASTAASSSGY